MFIDYTNQIFGDYTALEYDYNTHRWKCKCNTCGDIIYKRTNSLKVGKNLCKICISNKILAEMIGSTFGRLTVLDNEANRSLKGKFTVKTLIECRCSCGKIIKTNSNRLRCGTTQSCGCYMRDQASKANKRFNTYDLTGEFGKGYTLKGEEFWFDKDDYDKIKDYCWIYDKDGYVVCGDYKHRTTIRLNNFLLSPPKGYLVDHIKHAPRQGLKYDNRKSNLRIVDFCQSTWNTCVSILSKTGVKGVHFNKSHNRWQAVITVRKKKMHLGYFKNIEDAIKVRKEAEKKYYGEYNYTPLADDSKQN